MGCGLYRTSLGGKVRFYSDKTSKRMSFIVAWIYITSQSHSFHGKLNLDPGSKFQTALKSLKIK